MICDMCCSIRQASYRLIWVADNLSRSCCRPTFNIRLWLRFWADCPNGSGFGSVSLHYTYVFLHEKHSKLSSITRVQIASRFLHWNTRDIARSRFAGETPARSVTCIPTEKARRDLNASDAVFYHFQMAKTICQLVAWFKDTRVTQKSVPVGRVGRSVGRELCWSVGSLKLIKIIIFGRNSFVLWPRLNVRN